MLFFFGEVVQTEKQAAKRKIEEEKHQRSFILILSLRMLHGKTSQQKDRPYQKLEHGANCFFVK